MPLRRKRPGKVADLILMVRIEQMGHLNVYHQNARYLYQALFFSFNIV